MLQLDERTPAGVQRQLARLIEGMGEILGANLIGVYLHGSLAMGCFNPDSSDIDLLVRVRKPLDGTTERRVIDLLLTRSGRPAPIEISLLCDADLIPWRHPSPYTLHFSEDWRHPFERGEWPLLRARHPVDADLAANIAVLRVRGVVLTGPPVQDVFPPVPDADVRDSILRDCVWARERLAGNPVYAVLNMSRALRYFAEGVVCSKAEAGEWACAVAPEEVRPVAERALAIYRGEQEEFTLSPSEAARFLEITVGEGSITLPDGDDRAIEPG